MRNINELVKAKTKPFPHQIDAIKFVVDNDHCAIFDEQGLGKTKIIIDAVIYEMREKKIDGCLVISPKSLIKNWENEVKKHSYLVSSNLLGTKREKGYKYLSYANIYIINYEQVIFELPRIKDFLRINKFAIVLDESQRIKNPLAKTTQALLGISTYSTKKIILTGTPIANKPEDIWSQFLFLDGGKLLGDNFIEFKSKYRVSDTTQNNLEALKMQISKISMRRLKSDVLTLPNKKYIDIPVELRGKQKNKYKELTETLIVEIKNYEGDIILDENDYFVKRLLRLTQLASNPFLLDKSYNEIPAKLEALDDLVNDIISKQEKLIIWSSFVDNIRIIRNRYKNHGSLMLSGIIPIDQRNKYIDKFQNSNDHKIMVANPAAAREGITLSAANHAIYYDRNFNLVDYIQSQDRIHRISQIKQCYIYKIIARNSVDEFIEDRIYAKQSIASFLQGDNNIIPVRSNKLTKEEMLEILGG